MKKLLSFTLGACLCLGLSITSFSADLSLESLRLSSPYSLTFIDETQDLTMVFRQSDTMTKDERSPLSGAFFAEFEGCTYDIDRCTASTNGEHSWVTSKTFSEKHTPGLESNQGKSPPIIKGNSLTCTAKVYNVAICSYCKNIDASNNYLISYIHEDFCY